MKYQYKTPWKASHYGIGQHYQPVVLDANIGEVCQVHTDEIARIIAAAPELLAALIETVQVYEQHRDGQPTGHLWPDPNHITHARAAIKKAKGL